jgi:hypothetical protein
LRKDQNVLLEDNEIYWKQHALGVWLKEGDKNTKFLHAFASQRRRNNKIKILHDHAGQAVFDEQSIEHIAIN